MIVKLVMRQRRSVFETRVDVLEAVRNLGDEAISSKIASRASVTQRTLQAHLAFLQVKDLVTVADHTVEDRHNLQRRSMSNVFRITPEGRRVLSILLPIRDDLTSDKRRDWMESVHGVQRRSDDILTV